MEIVIATLVIGIIGLVIGFALVFAGQKFHVEVDEREAAVREVLPGNNCGACGFAGCDAMADAMQRWVAAVHCSGDCKHGVSSGMVSLDGNVQTLGSKPDGSLWCIGVHAPKGSASACLGVLSVKDRAVITSGGYERFFEESGQTYIHILDPRTGHPARSDLASAMVVSADGLSTALYIMGSQAAAQFWAERAVRFDMVLVTQSGEIFVTEDIAGQFESQAPVNVLKRQH